MVSCRYVGSDCCMIGEIEFDQIGQRASFSETSFREAVLGNALFITEELFMRCGFTYSELDEYGSVGMRCEAAPSFFVKLDLAQQFYHDLRARLVSEESIVVAESSDIGAASSFGEQGSR